MLSDQDIKNFQVLFENRFNKKIDLTEAREKATQLLNFMRVIYRPMDKEEFEKLKKYHESKL
jgi:hypothetical protein